MSLPILMASIFMLLSLSPEPEKAWLRWINPTPRDWAEQQTEAGYQKRNPQGVASPPADKHNEQATAGKAYKTNAEPNNIWEKAFPPETWSQWALLVVGIGGVIAALWSLRLLSTQVQADIESANAAKQSADTAERSLRLLERARVIVEDFQFIISKDRKSFSWTYTLMNIGRTPARIVERCQSYMQWNDGIPLPEKPVYAGRINRGQFVLFEGRGTKADDMFMPYSDEIPVLYAVGYYKYLDVFEIEHTTSYAFRYRPDGDAIIVDKPGYNVAT